MIELPARHHIESLVAGALAEDLGGSGDITTNATVPADATAAGAIVARRHGRIAGLEIGLEAFRQLDERVAVDVLRPDGKRQHGWSV